MSSRVREELSVAELVHYGPLGRARALVTADLDRRVSVVELVGELDQVRRCRPHTAIVLHHAAAHGVWAVESALRLAWERGASCVVAPEDVGVPASTVQLAERLRVALFTVSDDPARYALDLAGAIASPSAARAVLTARCAELFGERGGLRGIVGVVNAEVPGVSAALLGTDGRVLAGRSAAATDPVLRVPVPGPDGRPWAELVARLSTDSPGRVEVVRTILQLARAPLAAAVARSRLALADRVAKDQLILAALLRDEPSPEAEQAAADAGWRPTGNHVAVALRAEGVPVADATPGLVAHWQETFHTRPLIPTADGWVTWWTGDEVTPGGVARAVERGLSRLSAPVALAAGVGRAGRDLPGLRRSLTEAGLAAALAGRVEGSRVQCFADLGPRVVLACLPVAEVAAAAGVALREVVESPDGRTLVATIAAVLDCGGSTGQAGARLGVHRNTVIGRLDRLRAKGIDLDVPERRLALHIACYALLNAQPPSR
ncbi:PucR family transcriptional regulator [Saccharothrix australiensis]|uniref:PucR-like helix-turn-helix protein n=1 Tax=Saccharothrix australiensis TaxID=2072 RepID=A0A495VZ29_9PSEU|nr:helix-turn-helix domain-containing protein [Saccharothrix australiensis]RKT54606.1 PucR-like helix-turn-helix protein [Saccharothrix australiensis]